MAERLRVITVFLIIVYIFFEGIAYILGSVNIPVPFLVGIAIFAIAGLVAGYKAYDEMASNTDVFETIAMFIVVIIILTVLVSIFFYAISSIGIVISQGALSGGEIVGIAISSVLEYETFMRVLVLLVCFVGSWMALTVRKNAENPID